MARGLARPISGGERAPVGIYTIIKVFSIASNTFTESVRQPAYAVIIAVAAALIVVSPYVTMFTLQQTEKMMTDMGLATILLAGLLLAAFTASSVVSQEIENRTVLTVISKPTGRAEFVLGKFLGVMGGLVLAIYLLSLTLLLTISGGALEANNEFELSLIIVFSILGSIFLAAATAFTVTSSTISLSPVGRLVRPCLF